MQVVQSPHNASREGWPGGHQFMSPQYRYAQGAAPNVNESQLPTSDASQNRSSARMLAARTFGKYCLVAEIGRGGMADVFLAVVRGPAGFHKLRVIKLLKQHLAEDERLVTMFLDEARLAARLN